MVGCWMGGLWKEPPTMADFRCSEDRWCDENYNNKLKIEAKQRQNFECSRCVFVTAFHIHSTIAAPHNPTGLGGTLCMCVRAEGINFVVWIDGGNVKPFRRRAQQRDFIIYFQYPPPPSVLLPAEDGWAGWIREQQRQRCLTGMVVVQQGGKSLQIM